MPTGEDRSESAAEKQHRLARFRILDLSAVGLAFPIALLLGYFGGRAIGGWLGNAQVGGLVGALLGIAGGFYNLFKMVSRLAPPAGSGAAAPATATAAGKTGPEPELSESASGEEDEGDGVDDDWVEDDWIEDDRQPEDDRKA